MLRFVVWCVLVTSLGACQAGPGTPANPERFSISLWSLGCLGDCPVFELEIDEDGHVEYWGTRCVERFGPFEREVGEDEARMLYRDLRSANLWSWARRTRGRCEISDGWVQGWTLDVDGYVDMASIDAGCANADKMQRMQDLMVEGAQATDWVGKGQPEFNCGYDLAVFGLPRGSFVLRDEATSVGILSLDVKWNVKSCEGEALATGDVKGGEDGAILLPEGRQPISWPGVEAAHSVELLVDGTVRVDALQGVVEQSLQERSACHP